jgi:hypothetical protein
MEDLRLVGLSADGSRLVLENAAGAQLALPLDERVHAALRGDRSRLGQLQIAVDGQLRPREIQARIRAGHSAEEVAASAGLPVDSVRRFETPILLERTHMAQTAQGVGVRRVTDSVTTPLGVLVQSRLDEHGVAADTLDWDSWRRDDGRWTVTLAYEAGGSDRTASWIFDPVRRVIEPADEEARWLTDEERAVPVPAPGRGGRSGATKLAAVPEPAEPAEPADEAAHVFDIVEVTEVAEVSEVARPAAPDEPAAPAAKARPAGRRASVPSWDEILFGAAPRRDED